MTSKLSLYLDRFGGDAVPWLSLQENGIGDLLASGVTVVKIQNNASYLRWVRSVYPSVIAIGRNTGVEDVIKAQVERGEIVLGQTSPDAIASRWFNLMRLDIEVAGPGVYWCWPFCEPNKADIDALNKIALSMMKLGVPMVIGEFSAEFNLYDVEDRFKPALDQIIAGNHILGLHAYDNNLPAPGNRKLVDSPFLFPHKRLKTRARIVLTELGIDAIFSENRMCSGWKKSGLSAAQFAAWLIAADVGCRKDARVIGETVYISSRNADDEEKAPFFTSFRKEGRNHEPPEPCVDDHILTYNYALSEPVEVPPPVEPTPPGAPKPGKYITTGEVNIRVTPDRNTAEIGSIKANKPLPVPEFVSGEVYKGNPYWAKLGSGLHVSAYFLKSA